MTQSNYRTGILGDLNYTFLRQPYISRENADDISGDARWMMTYFSTLIHSERLEKEKLIALIGAVKRLKENEYIKASTYSIDSKGNIKIPTLLENLWEILLSIYRTAYMDASTDTSESTIQHSMEEVRSIFNTIQDSISIYWEGVISNGQRTCATLKRGISAETIAILMGIKKDISAITTLTRILNDKPQDNDSYSKTLTSLLDAANRLGESLGVDREVIRSCTRNIDLKAISDISVRTKTLAQLLIDEYKAGDKDIPLAIPDESFWISAEIDTLVRPVMPPEAPLTEITIH